ncbi:MAG: LysR family transcriptional regulator [Rhodoferax sp.]|nr:LysR family transcriptional regulator [Rhodoferax sp.]
MQDLNDMFYFAEVVEQGSFAAAGRALGLPKSRLSRRVAELETRLGVRLLQRTTRKLSLTEVGEVYFRHCAAMRSEAGAADEAVLRVRSEPRGTVRVTCPITLAQGVLGEQIPRFLAAFPQVRIEMEVTNRAVDLVEEGIDVALRVRTSLEGSASLVVKRLSASVGILLTSPAQLARQGRPETPQDLHRLDTVAMSAVDGRAALRLVGPEGAEFTWHHQPRFVADDLLTLKHAMVNGTGVGFLPDYMCAAEIADGRLVPLLPGWSLPPGLLHAVFPSRRGLVPAVRVFLDFLGEAQLIG